MKIVNRRQFLVTSAAALAAARFVSFGNFAYAAGKNVVYSDTHAHLDSFPEEDLKKILVKMKENNVGLVLNQSINLLTSAESIKIAQANEGIYACVGIHPGEAIPLTDDVKKKLEELSGQKKVVGFGEIGLMSSDYDEEQKQLLLFQVALAKKKDLLLDIHCGTDAYKECIGMVKGTRGIIHGFTGTMDDLKAWLEIGYYISLGQVGGGVGMPGGAAGGMGGMPGGAAGGQGGAGGTGGAGGSGGGMPQRQSMSEDVIKAIPAERLVTETDCMARQNSRWEKLGKKPMGGQGGAPGSMSGGPGNGQGGAPGGMPSGQGGAPSGKSGGPGSGAAQESDGPVGVVKVVESIAKVRGVSSDEIANLALKNIKRLLKIS